MKLEEAIEIFEDINTWNKPYWVEESREAARLLIEAGKLELKVRRLTREVPIQLLPGETKL